AVAEHVGGDDVVAGGECVDGVFPAQLGAGAELPAVQQYHRLARARLQVTGAGAVHVHRAPHGGDRRAHRLPPPAGTNDSSCAASRSSWARTVLSTSTPSASHTGSAELIATPSGVGQARSAWPMTRSWPRVPTAACQP